MSSNNNENKHDQTQALGIDFANFIDNDTTMNSISTSNDFPIIEEWTTQHNQIQQIISKRNNSIKLLVSIWEKGDIMGTIKQWWTVKDKGCTCDFFNYAFMKNGYNKDYLRIEESVELIPWIVSLVASKYDSHNKIGNKMVCMLFDMYSDSIRSVRRSMKGEEKTIEMHARWISFFTEVTAWYSKKKGWENDTNLKALVDEMKEFIKDCNK